MSLHLEKCLKCCHVYLLEQFSPAFGPGQRAGVVECPHCGETAARNPKFVYVSRKLPKEIEDWPEQ